MTTTQQNFSDFVTSTLVEGLENNLLKENRNGFTDYIAFATIFAGIELMGNIHDSYEMNEGKPSARFQKGMEIMKQIDTRYSKHKELLWKSYRCGMAHQFRPLSGIKLNSNRENTGLPHLDFADGILTLQIDKFFEDYKETWFLLLKEISKGTTGSVASEIDNCASRRKSNVAAAKKSKKSKEEEKAKILEQANKKKKLVIENITSYVELFPDRTSTGGTPQLS